MRHYESVTLTDRMGILRHKGPYSYRKAGRLYLIVLTLFVLVELASCSRFEKYLYCPLGRASCEGIGIDAYLVLDEFNEPAFVEVRRVNPKDHWYFRTEEIIFRAYGAEDLKMKRDTIGIRFQLFSHSSDLAAPDAVFSLDVLPINETFELHLASE